LEIYQQTNIEEKKEEEKETQGGNIK